MKATEKNLYVDYKKTKGRRRNPFAVRFALILSILAAIIIVFITMTVFSSNHLLNIDKNVLSNVPSNILPSYSTTSFESIDGQTSLQGWFFKTKNPVSTIIVNHDTGSNRLPFGVEMIDMIESWLDNGYNVFLYDQRNSGTSGGDISCYGYLEWQDVLGAISIVRKISVTTDVILFGIGTGCTSQILAYKNLPSPNMNDLEISQYSRNIREIGFDRSYIKGMIFDSPAKMSDDYIRPVVVQKEFMGFLTQYFVPYAIRVSAGSDNVNLAAEIARLPIPVMILYGGHDNFVGADKINQIISERGRLNQSLTKSIMITGAGYLEEYTINKNEYIDAVYPSVSKALTDANITLDDLDCVAVTYGPGLVGALLVGLSAAKGLCEVKDLPLVGVHHLKGHIAANYLCFPELEPPFLCLCVSGGNTMIIRVDTYTDMEILGRTRDDAAGEAIDKIARVIGLGYPGGPKMDKAGQGGDTSKYKFAKTHMTDTLDFSFSGIKTSALNLINGIRQKGEEPDLKDFTASYQQNIAEILLDNTLKAAEITGLNKICLAGGVSANSFLRKAFDSAAGKKGLDLYYPNLRLCTDNGAMIASAGYFEYINGTRHGLDLNACPSLKL